MAGQQYQISVRAVGRLSEPAQFDNIILKTNSDGTLVRLRDVGHAELGAESYANDLQFNGQDAIGMAVTQLSTANALDVDRKAIAELDRLSKSFPPGMHFKVAFDTTDAVGEWIRDVVYTVGSAILLVILVIFIFLGDWRTTMIHFIATPVSLIGTFIFVKLLGFSINTLTLFGITLAVGLVVDDAIVVIENIERHIQEGEHDSHKAAAAATAEITSAVIATSLVLLAVFVPVAFFPGTTGILFRQFALTIAFSIAISAFNALTLAPVLAAIFLSGSHHQKWWWLQKFDDGVVAMTRGYQRAAAYRAGLQSGDDGGVFRRAGADLFHLHPGADGIRARRRPGIFHHCDSGAVRGVARLYESDWQAGCGHAGERARIGRDVLDCGLQFLGSGGESGTYFCSVEALFATQRRRPYRVGDSDSSASAAVWDFWGHRVCHAAAAYSGPGPVRRISVCGAGSGRAQA